MASRRQKLTVILLSYLSVLGLTVNLRIAGSNEKFLVQLVRAFKGISITHILLFIGLYVLYTYAFRHIKTASWTLREKILVVLPAGLFAGSIVVGYSFAQTNSLDLILKGNIQKVKSLVAFVGYGLMFAIFIAYIYISGLGLLQQQKRTQRKGLLGRYKSMLVKFPFRTTFLTLIIVYIPYMIFSYPAIFMGDTGNVVLQGFNFPDSTSRYLNLIDESVKINGHHPVIYTLFIHACLVVGNSVFGSYNVGIFLAALCQLLGVCAVVALAVRTLSKIQLHENILLGLVVYFAVAPRIQNYMFLITKDVLAACMLMLFSLSAFQMAQGEISGCRAWTGLSLFGIAMGLLRNDGKYIILGSIVVMLVLIKEHKKTLLASGVTVAVVLSLFFEVLMPGLHITPTSKREALSVPFQQTARYFRDYGQEVTTQEREAVAAVLDTSSIGEKYNPDSSDAVKATFRETATKEELAAYFKAWFRMGLKHPGVYIQATLNNYYNYFYPGEKLAAGYYYGWSKTCMGWIENNEDMRSIGCSFYYPKAMDEARTTYEKLRESVFEVPVLSLLKSSAVYVWVLMLLVFYFTKRKAWSALALMTPLVLSVGICFLGPCNGDYFRYLYGVSVCLPVVSLQSLYLCKNSKGKEA